MKHPMLSNLRASLALSIAIGACAGTVVPAERLASTQAAIRSAREVGAEQEPTAALYLQYAREQFAQADRLSQGGDGPRAERLLQRAQADAELSMAISRRAAARAAADQVAARAAETPAPTPPTTPTNGATP